MEKEFLVQFQGGEVLAANAAVKINKLLQISSGSLYTGEGYEVLHDAKLDALQEIVDTASEPILVAYNFKSDAERILKRIKGAVLMDKDNATIDKWNKKKIPVLLCHPASSGHGLNLQAGGSVIVWFGLSWSLELYQQLNARLHRQGQTKPVRIIKILADTKCDLLVADSLSQKNKTQSSLLEFVERLQGGKK